LALLRSAKQQIDTPLIYLIENPFIACYHQMGASIHCL
jgi:hypothetical protein